jgi:hypothetical protein
MRKTIVICDRCGKVWPGEDEKGWRMVWPPGFVTRGRRDFTPDELAIHHACLECLEPDELEEIAELDVQELRRELAWGVSFDDEP